jgi:hypothetical protein
MTDKEVMEVFSYPIKRACVRMGAVSAYETCLNLLKSGTPVDGMITILESNIKRLNGGAE